MDQKQGTKANPIAFDHESPEHAENWPDEFREMREKCPVAWTDRHGTAAVDFPFVRIGDRCLYDPEEVFAALKRSMIGGGAVRSRGRA